MFISCDDVDFTSLVSSATYAKLDGKVGTDCMSPQEKYDLWKALDDSRKQYEEKIEYEKLKARQRRNARLRQMVEDVKFSGDRTIVFFGDGTKVVVKCQEGDTFDKEKGLAVACMKKLFDNTNVFNEVMRKWCGNGK